MSFIRFNKVPKHQSFNYIPRHWDADKEELQARVNAATGQASDPELTKARIRTGLKRKSRAGTSSPNRNSAIRLVAIIAILMILSYYFLMSDSILAMIEAFD